jgi:polyferredoxin
MIYGEVTQKLSLWLFPRELKKWPRESAEKWGGLPVLVAHPAVIEFLQGTTLIVSVKELKKKVDWGTFRC